MVKKKINEDSMLSELSESNFFRPNEAEEDETTAQQSGDSSQDELVDNVVDSGVDSEAGQPVDQSTGVETGRQNSKPQQQRTDSLRKRGGSTGGDGRRKQQQNPHFDNSPVLSRPKSFYITKKQDADIDDIAERIEEILEGKIAHKIDRSVVVRLILESQEWTSEDAVEMLSKHLVSKLVSQLVD